MFYPYPRDANINSKYNYIKIYSTPLSIYAVKNINRLNKIYLYNYKHFQFFTLNLEFNKTQYTIQKFKIQYAYILTNYKIIIIIFRYKY